MPVSSRYALRNKRIWVAGHRGLVGSALVRRLAEENCEIVIAPREKFDLRIREHVDRVLAEAKPDAIFLAAAKVGGIYANSSMPADFIHDNLAIELNVIDAARSTGVEKLMLLGSSCIYPRFAQQPISESALLTGPLESTNEWYAIAKIAGIKLAQAFRRQSGCDFISVMPTNLYGPGDRFDPLTSHVVPALIVKAHEAKTKNHRSMSVWGSGKPLREFLYVDDAAEGMVFLMKHYSDEQIVNLGTGNDIPVAVLAALVADAVGFQGTLTFDSSKPDGTPRKLLDVSRAAALGWRARTPLKEGLARTYQWYLENRHSDGERTLAHV
jgi:GDP-L-fucose synthase